MISTNDWRNQIKLEDLPEIYQDMAEYIGIAAALDLGEKMGGEDFYLPKEDNRSGAASWYALDLKLGGLSTSRHYW